jgi:hypothetical protein
MKRHLTLNEAEQSALSPSNMAYGLRALTLAVLLALSGCDEDPPAIGAGLPTNFADARAAFDHRVQERFPIGSDESALRAELMREKFHIAVAEQPQQFVAHRSAEHFPCRLSWTILWSSVDGKIAAIKSNYTATCP